ncbi:MAG: diaminopimelate epimerase [Deltaproteobacteria bacterium]|nr:diaminopimelate epimerase [Deltaproteobacteria bacterium]
MKIPFTKMSGCGNDFILIDHRSQFLQNENLIELTQALCHRKNGVGADGLILIERSAHHAFQWKFFNSDGSIPDMCGNGARCAARFAQDKNIAEKHFFFNTAIGSIEAFVLEKTVKIQMFEPTGLKLDVTLEGLSAACYSFREKIYS